MNKSFFLIYIVILTFCAVAQANTCLDAVYKYHSFVGYNPETDIHADSVHLKYFDFEFNDKIIYTNKKIDHIKDTEYDTYTYRYYDTDESALSHENREILLSKCEAHDTLCIQAIVYKDGVYAETDFIKMTQNYTRNEILSGEGEKFAYVLFEYFLKKDSMIVVYTFDTDSNFNGGMTRQIVYVADSLDDVKCYEYEGDEIANVTYKTTEKGFSLSFSDDSTYISESFFVIPKQTNSIRKTVKPVKISPKARYFDLLGRYKFTK